MSSIAAVRRDATGPIAAAIWTYLDQNGGLWHARARICFAVSLLRPTSHQS
jgi:hypothetical protein